MTTTEPRLDERTDATGLTASLLVEEQVTDGVLDLGVPDELIPTMNEDAMSVRDVVKVGGASTIGVLSLLNLVDEFDRITIQILGPDIQDTFGISDTMLTLLANVGAVAVFLGTIPLGLLADRRRRVTIVGVTSFLWAVAALAGGFTRSIWQLMGTRVFNGIGKSSGPVMSSILADAYPMSGRGRVFAVYNLANPLGNFVGPLMAGGLAAWVGGTEGWRWSLAVLAVPAIILSIVSLRLKEPRRGGFEREAAGIAEEHETEAEIAGPEISFGAGAERLRSIKTFNAMLIAFGALGLSIAGVPTIYNLILEDRFGLDGFGRGLVTSITSVGGIIGLIYGGKLTDDMFRNDPAKLMKLVGIAFGALGVLTPLSLFMPHIALLVALQLGGSFMGSLVGAALSPVISVIIPDRMRGLSFGLVGIYLVLVGGLIGGLITGMLSDSVGQRFAISLIMPVSLGVGGIAMYSASAHIRGDMARLVQDLREEKAEADRIAAAQGDDDELLQVRGLDFAYGQVQVLFDVDLTVKKGEVLALLGTNGAGKSTVLRAISGLGIPSTGVIRHRGKTITFADPTSRVRGGIVQVAGGKAIFPTLTVRENLIAGAYTFVWDKRRVEERGERVLDIFPRLAERLDQPAGTLSGGEAQMLALAKALMLEPDILLIDELSLGLAPAVVQEILSIVEQLKEQGMTMIVVEQSVNVALSIAERAVFMEKGRVKFEGPAQELLERDDLVRAVFLGGEGG